MTVAGVEVRRAEARQVSRGPGTETLRSFSFGSSYDPTNVRFGDLVAHNEERLEPGAGYDAHRHVGLEIVTWVLEGTLTHIDSAGHRAHTESGTVQHLSAGHGIEHTERNEGSGRLRFLQMWLLGDADVAPTYEQVKVLGEGPVMRLSTGPVLHVLRPETGSAVRIPPGGCVHLSVLSGSLVLDGSGAVRAGDTLRVVGPAGDTPALVATEPSEILAWQLHGLVDGEMEES